MAIYEPYVQVEDAQKVGEIKPRKEQTEAVNAAFDYFKKNKGKGPEFLWNAKMRFGKTVSALWLIEKLYKDEKMRMNKVLILTHRPVVNASWYDDFVKLFGKDSTEYSYGTAKETKDEDNYKGFDEIKKDATANKCVLFFVSMQYLRLSHLVGGAQKDDKNKEDILKYDWDLIIVDEAHEGTQTELGDNVISYLHKDKTCLLYLSGTPFNLLEKFTDDQIYNWDYIKEQEAKNNWEKEHPGEENPYRDLPRMEIFTFQLSEMVTDEQAIRDVATGKFSFSEFFRVKTGSNLSNDERGKFVHEAEVKQFIKKLREKSETSHYPFSTDEFRNAFRHTLWVVPGVKEAKALQELLEKDDFCTNLKFKVINVAGNSDKDEQRSDALDKVLKVIRVSENSDDSDQTRTITLSCGRLTTGVTVRPWTAVLYLKGADTTAASTYMQTIFRTQSPHIINGKMKSVCYVFDFAPERALTMMAETAKYSRAFEKKGGHKQKSVIEKEDKEQMTKLLAVCPIYRTKNGTPLLKGKMTPIDVNTLFSKLNEVYTDKVVRNGFEHPSLYIDEELINPSLEDEMTLNQLRDLFYNESTSARQKNNQNTISVNHTNLTPEQIEAIEEEQKKQEQAGAKAREKAEVQEKEKLSKMSDEEREAYLNEKAEKAKRRKLIEQNRNKLAGLSRRIPLMMYGANIEEFGDVTLENFTDPKFIDDESWNEFMPKGVSREVFQKLSKFYNADIFRCAGAKIRQLAREADSMNVEERIDRITQIFKWFKNPDKETVLTPWEVVNRHLSSTIGGYCFFEEDFKTPCIQVDKVLSQNGNANEAGQTENVDWDAYTRLVDQCEVTKYVFGNENTINQQMGSIDTKVLEINSKTGLYPLYVAYSLYRNLLPIYATYLRLKNNASEYSAEDEQAIWDEVVKNNLYVICKTKMAERITRRTLLGFRHDTKDKEIKIHIKQIDNLIEQMDDKNREELIDKLNSEKFWNDDNEMKDKELRFNVVVGNPPYQVQKGGTKNIDIWPKFVSLACALSDRVSLIHPARWVVPNETMKEVQKMILEKLHLEKFYYYPNSRDLFPSVGIDGGISIAYYNKNYKGAPSYYIDGENMGSFDKDNFFSDKYEKEVWDKLNPAIFGGGTMLENVLGNVGSLGGGEFGYRKAKHKKYLKDSAIGMKNPVKVWANSGTGKGSRYAWHYIERDVLDANANMWKLLTTKKVMISKNGHAITTGKNNIFNNDAEIVPKNAIASGDVFFILPDHPNGPDLVKDLKLIKSLLETKTARFLMSISQKGICVRGFENIPHYTYFKEKLNGKLFTDTFFYEEYHFSPELRQHIEENISAK